MLDEKYFDEVITNLKNRLDKHDSIMEDMQEDIENLRMSETEIKVKLNSIETTQIEIKAMIQDSNNKLIDTIREDRKNENKIKLQDRKELWAVASAILSAIVVKLLEMFGGK